MKKKISGYIFPMILMATLAVGFFIVTMTQLQRSTKAQFSHLNEYQRAFSIAYSALVEILASVQEKQWSNRTFKNAPVAWTKDLYEGQYNLMAEDYDPAKYLFNVKIRVKYASKYYMFYWRMKYIPELLDFTTLVIPLYFAQFPATNIPADFTDPDSKVDADLQKREENREKAITIAKKVIEQPTVERALETLGVPDGNLPTGLPPRPQPQPLVIPANAVLVKPIDKIVEETPGIAKPKIDQVFADLSLSDIYPPPTDIKDRLTVPLSRFELVVYVVRLLEIPETNDQLAVDNFNDISPSTDPVENKFNIAVSSAFAFNLVVGWEGDFYGTQVMRREHMAVLLGNIDRYIDMALPDIGDQSLKNKYVKVQQWIRDNQTGYDQVNPLSGMTVSDGMEMLLALN